MRPSNAFVCLIDFLVIGGDEDEGGVIGWDRGGQGVRELERGVAKYWIALFRNFFLTLYLYGTS